MISVIPNRKLLVCSIGNPGQIYINSRHSAGHKLIELLQHEWHKNCKQPNPPFSKNGGNYKGFVSVGPTYTLYKSPSYMNVSGKHIKSAWNAFQTQLSAMERQSALLVIIHDELDRPFGRIRVRAKGSAGGHNGLISCIQSLRTDEFHRIGIGIRGRGAPQSKESKVVSEYVLGTFTEDEEIVLKSNVLSMIDKELHALSYHHDTS
ncbi:peptidyl-tRNA hydrolase [Geopyxis carbonaria]|nr:peptidyl-tRNA hydrolase [Geopyxis carbonaria]